MATLQQQARALGDRTRHAIFRYITDADAPVGVAELTDHLGLNHNAIRQHLAKLVDAQLVVGATAPTGGRGRPRLMYELHPTADSRWGAVGPYERLSLMLTEVLRTGDSPETVGVRTGETYPRANDADEAVTNLTDAMARLGFEPEVRKRGARTDIVLENCPFETAALADPTTICALHLGLSEGIAEGSGVAVEELIAKDPRRAGCRLRLRPATDDGATGEQH
ncbi:MAG TPA: helix-turn-helix domain-containing protein [Acidimicrobiales bacterium]